MGISTHNTALLIDKVKAELFKRGYKPESVQRYQSCWNDLLKFATAHTIDSYSPQTGMFFLEEIYGMTVFASLSEQEKLRARAINLLNDYTQNGMIFSGNSTSSTDYLKFYQSVLDDFKKH